MTHRASGPLLALACPALASALLATLCLSTMTPAQSRVSARVNPTVQVENLEFKDLNGNGTEESPIRLYTMGMDAAVVGDERWDGYAVTSGDYDAAGGETRPAVPAGTDYAILRIEVSNAGADPELIFGGADPDELDLLAFSDMETARSWSISPSLADIQEVMREAGPGRTILALYFRQPFVLDEASGLRDAGAILATFGVRDATIMDVLTGSHAPSGKLPFALATTPEAVVDQAPDAPGYPEEQTLFPFGHGLSY